MTTPPSPHPRLRRLAIAAGVLFGAYLLLALLAYLFTALIEAYLRRIPAQPSLENAPIVRRLTGTLSPGVTIQDYKKHLEEKYGR